MTRRHRMLAQMALWVAGWSILEGIVSFEASHADAATWTIVTGMHIIAWLVVMPPTTAAMLRWPVFRSKHPFRHFSYLVLTMVIAGSVNGLVVSGLLTMVSAVWHGIPLDLIGSAAAVVEVKRGIGQFFVYLCLPLLMIREVEIVREDRAERERSKTTLAKAQLHAMAVELQPHFLFNTLNAIATLVRSDPRTAEAMIIQLSDLLRATLDGIEEGESSLGDEADRLLAYVTLQRMRFGPRLNVTIDVPRELRNAKIPAMILQPLVENAMTHGIGPKDGPGHLSVTAVRMNDRLELVVTDDGVGLPDGYEDRLRIGVGNTARRLTMLFPSDLQFQMRNLDAGGAQVSVNLPYQEMPVRAHDHR